MAELIQLSREDYDALPAANWSTLKELARSPAHYRHLILNKDEDRQKDTDARKRGRCSHFAIFEPEIFARDVVVWRGGDRRGGKWDAFKAFHEASGHEILLPREYDQVRAIGDAVRRHPLASRFVSKGRSEWSLRWDFRMPALGGLPEVKLPLKGRPDFVADEGFLVDVKSVRDASSSGFGRAVANYAMHGQIAMYSDGLAEAWRRVPAILIAVEATPPYAVGVYEVPEDILEAGRELYRDLLQRLVLCRETNHWPDYGEEVMQLSLPSWALPRDDEEDLADLGLTFNAGNGD